jgi:hypothetical protein
MNGDKSFSQNNKSILLMYYNTFTYTFIFNVIDVFVLTCYNIIVYICFFYRLCIILIFHSIFLFETCLKLCLMYNVKVLSWSWNADSWTPYTRFINVYITIYIWNGSISVNITVVSWMGINHFHRIISRYC